MRKNIGNKIKKEAGALNKYEIVYEVEAKSLTDVEENLEEYLEQAMTIYGNPKIRKKDL